MGSVYFYVFKNQFSAFFNFIFQAELKNNNNLGRFNYLSLEEVLRSQETHLIQVEMGRGLSISIG